MLDRFGKRLRSFIDVDPWTNVYGIARTILAVGSLCTLVFNSAPSLFRAGAGVESVPICQGILSFSLYCQVPRSDLWIVRWIAIAILVVVASGWRPRVTGILHWWVSFSFQGSSLLIDGGDQITAVLTFLLLPITLTDDRTWHWDKRTGSSDLSLTEPVKRLVARTSLVIIRVQVAVVYLHASVGKMAVDEWTDGTALYYWFTDPTFGMPGRLDPILMPLVSNGITVALMTWGVILFELLLFTALVMERRWWSTMLTLALLFHSGIAIIHGLPSFALAMFGALILFLRPPEKIVALDWIPDPILHALPRLKARLEKINWLSTSKSKV